jgi:anti-sigma regulatory factor (Ser/Thr protein kinase)
VRGTTRSLTTAAEISSLAAVTEFVRTGALEAKLPDERVNELDLLLEEMFVNVCRYAYPDGKPGNVSVTYSIPAPGELSVGIADQGVEFNPLSAEPPDLTLNLEERPIGGLGILLLKKLTTSLTYRREDGWNRLTFGVSAGS